jgi:hypothetical protein
MTVPEEKLVELMASVDLCLEAVFSVCVVKQCDRSSRRSQEDSVVVFSEGVVAD